jgi:predicted unusual protein kinase regulating ubiquinone biosynthesis (AarF/ABC1/UbiB family)
MLIARVHLAEHAAHLACNAAPHASQDHDSKEYQDSLALLHEACSRRLLALCQSNGGVYIKAAQLITTAQAAPPQYRRLHTTAIS